MYICIHYHVHWLKQTVNINNISNFWYALMYFVNINNIPKHTNHTKAQNILKHTKCTRVYQVCVLFTKYSHATVCQNIQKHTNGYQNIPMNTKAHQRIPKHTKVQQVHILFAKHTKASQSIPKHTKAFQSIYKVDHCIPRYTKKLLKSSIYC